MSVACATCGQSKPQRHFSSSQLNKGPERRCKQCLQQVAQSWKSASLGPAPTPQDLKRWRARITTAFAETYAFPGRELVVMFSPVHGATMQAVLVRADGTRDDYTVRLEDGSHKDCTSSRLTRLCGVRKLSGAAPHARQLLDPHPQPRAAAGAAAVLDSRGRLGSGLVRFQQLVDMGFPASHADDALHATGEEIEAAIEACLCARYPVW